jgi:ATP-dependent helicase HepA
MRRGFSSVRKRYGYAKLTPEKRTDLLSTMEWLPGQRVRNEAEPALGLGVVHKLVDSRTLEVQFPAAREVRAYRLLSAPLRRFVLGIGQVAQLRDGRQFRVERVTESEGLLSYWGGGQHVGESELADSSQSTGPMALLMEGELSHYSSFDLRELAWTMRGAFLGQRSRGLAGARVALLPHQLSIALRVSSLELPRVLLADEVGLGKTIEACMIFSVLRALGRADRVLILTPPSLVHQWLAELYRRFNELFKVAHSEHVALVDEEMAFLAEGQLEENPFEDASRVIAPLDWLMQPKRMKWALEHEWDLVIVDEAHHLGWTPQKSSQQYKAVQALGKRTRGLLLLTATPLRQGQETQFALLHLVDPERFPDYSAFVEEHARLRPIADLAKAYSLDPQGEAGRELARTFPEDHALVAALGTDPSQALSQLVDRHGTGRVLIRNRRERLGGFPGRELHIHPLPCPESWKAATIFREESELSKVLHVAVSASAKKPTTKDDPRWAWVVAFVRALPATTKVLIMASRATSVTRLAQVFRKESGLKVAVFHEDLSLIERDRQAAYFAEDDGAQVLLSSEIGGEGRNFQFCHHLVLFDLPVHPDALEQRIGRLDRIGQSETIQIDVPFVQETPSEALLRWLEAMGAFAHPLQAGDFLLEQVGPQLLEVFKHYRPGQTDSAQLEPLLELTARKLAQHRENTQANVDFLVDLNSFDQKLGQELVDEINGLDLPLLKDGMSKLLEHFGVVEEDLAQPGVLKLREGDLMKFDPFPGLRPGGVLATYRRDLALSREELQFLSIDHPLVDNSLGLLLEQLEGKASLALWAGAPEQTIAVQFGFVLQAIGPRRLELERYLSPTPVMVTLDLKGTERDWHPPKLQSLGATIWSRLSGPLHARLPELLEKATHAAHDRLQGKLDEALRAAGASLEQEQNRKLELQRLGNLSQAEVDSHAVRMERTLERLRTASLELDALRVIVLDPRP